MWPRVTLLNSNYSTPRVFRPLQFYLAINFRPLRFLFANHVQSRSFIYETLLCSLQNCQTIHNCSGISLIKTNGEITYKYPRIFIYIWLESLYLRPFFKLMMAGTRHPWFCDNKRKINTPWIITPSRCHFKPRYAIHVMKSEAFFFYQSL